MKRQWQWGLEDIFNLVAYYRNIRFAAEHSIGYDGNYCPQCAGLGYAGCFCVGIAAPVRVENAMEQFGGNDGEDR